MQMIEDNWTETMTEILVFLYVVVQTKCSHIDFYIFKSESFL